MNGLYKDQPYFVASRVCIAHNSWKHRGKDIAYLSPTPPERFPYADPDKLYSIVCPLCDEPNKAE